MPLKCHTQLLTLTQLSEYYSKTHHMVKSQ